MRSIKCKNGIQDLIGNHFGRKAQIFFIVIYRNQYIITNICRHQPTTDTNPHHYKYLQTPIYQIHQSPPLQIFKGTNPLETLIPTVANIPRYQHTTLNLISTSVFTKSTSYFFLDQVYMLLLPSPSLFLPKIVFGLFLRM